MQRVGHSLAVATIARWWILSYSPCYSADHFFGSHHRQMVDRSCHGTFHPPPLGRDGYVEEVGPSTVPSSSRVSGIAFGLSDRKEHVTTSNQQCSLG
ncbi:MAG: hypothetical protein ACK44Z_06840, partial [Pirellulaceae bacterium]